MRMKSCFILVIHLTTLYVCKSAKHANLFYPHIKVPSEGLCTWDFLCKFPKFCLKTYETGKYECYTSKEVSCKDQKDCRKNEICLVTNKAGAAVCVDVDVCTYGKPLKSLNGGDCENKEDCPKSSDPDLEPECVVFRTVPGAPLAKRSSCCFRQRRCRFGVPMKPMKKCEGNEECNVESNKAIPNDKKGWCDESGYCCRDSDKLVEPYCPDGVTFVFDGEKCDSVESYDAHSGICSKPGGICRYGHCCPGLDINHEGGVLGENSYVTNEICNLNEGVPKNLKFAYCNGEKIVIIGKMDIDGKEIQKDEKNRTCKINSDCVKIDLKYCVRETAEELYCYRTVESSSTDLPLLWIIVAVCGAIIVIIIIVFICISSLFKKKRQKKGGKKNKDKKKKKRREVTQTTGGVTSSSTTVGI